MRRLRDARYSSRVGRARSNRRSAGRKGHRLADAPNTNCELGLTMAPESCEQPLLDYFRFPLVLVLAIPIALFLVAAVVCRSSMSWVAAGTMLVLTAVGFYNAGMSTPSLWSPLASAAPVTVPALVLAVFHQLAASRKSSNQTMPR
ncbi:hypothetical protein E5720_07755 [Rhodococcus sp. PAMC28707]|uniref:hypothetical protein n=1 Tax=unclassified Rhodococcus (in: high G+C Gram-positive bacteria) TaxID=192944 RepID=UPI00109D89E9|nr:MULTISPECIES: hypothetical protein [unclassified Rhodococcus (in: high G+C Gram-positive bacteria)]QCB49887.1 hypothetical protein E5769_06260 [Rhodococcus sp. PAMC28705]QCB58420.1 hypothetical protein E5720_07755 [Rhodococcus sp. PAMC28707]